MKNNICKKYNNNDFVELINDMIYVTIKPETYLVRGVISKEDVNFGNLFNSIEPDSIQSNIKFYGYFENNSEKFAKSLSFIKKYSSDGVYESVVTTQEIKLLHIPYYAVNGSFAEIRRLSKNYRLLQQLINYTVKPKYVKTINWALATVFYGSSYLDDIEDNNDNLEIDVNNENIYASDISDDIIDYLENPVEPENPSASKYLTLNSDLVFALFLECIGISGFVRYDIENSTSFSPQEICLINPEKYTSDVDFNIVKNIFSGENKNSESYFKKYEKYKYKISHYMDI